MKRLIVAVLFGGRCPEHEVSIITGIQVLHALDKNKYEPVPVYIAKDGRWFLGDKSFFRPETYRDIGRAIQDKKEVIPVFDESGVYLTEKPSDFTFLKFPLRKKIDVFFPSFHGRYGEDGSIQGMLEMYNAAYVGCDVQASSTGMDKVLSKKVARAVNIPILDDVWFTKSEWQNDRRRVIKRIGDSLGFPVFIKPARLGSSIGVVRAVNTKELENGIETGLFYDPKILVEKSLEGAKEINISIMGNDPYELSACEQPVSSGRVLTYEDKYVSKNGTSKGMASAKRIVPAPIKKLTEEKIKEYSRHFFSEIGGQGIARIDFLVSGDESEIYFNEINTMPGSVAFYLWKEAGVGFGKLTDKLITYAMERKRVKDTLVSTFQSNILEGFSGVKGAKKF